LLARSFHAGPGPGPCARPVHGQSTSAWTVANPEMLMRLQRGLRPRRHPETPSVGRRRRAWPSCRPAASLRRGDPRKLVRTVDLMKQPTRPGGRLRRCPASIQATELSARLLRSRTFFIGPPVAPFFFRCRIPSSRRPPLPLLRPLPPDRNYKLTTPTSAHRRHRRRATAGALLGQFCGQLLTRTSLVSYNVIWF